MMMDERPASETENDGDQAEESGVKSIKDGDPGSTQRAGSGDTRQSRAGSGDTR